MLLPVQCGAMLPVVPWLTVSLSGCLSMGKIAEGGGL